MGDAHTPRHQLLSLVPGLVKETHFSASEVRRLLDRFLDLARPAPAPLLLTMLREDFLQQPELVFCTVASRAFDIELFRQRAEVARGPEAAATSAATNGAASGGGALGAEEGDDFDPRNGLMFATYVRMMSHFSPKAPIEEKKMYLGELLGGSKGSPPTKEAYTRYLTSVSAAQLPGSAVVAAADEVWESIGRISQAPAGDTGGASVGLLPCSAVDLEALMTIPF